MEDVTLLRRVRARRTNGLAFFKAFLRYPERIGSVIPSSRFLEQRLVRLAEVERASLVVELGPGTGGTTQAMLNAMSPESTLLAIELNPGFIDLLREDADPRLRVHAGSAERLEQILRREKLARPDAVVSGIPFSTLPREVGRNVLRAVWAQLAPGGRFVAYQFRDQVAMLGRDLLGTPQVSLEMRNVPPVRMYTWRKPYDEDLPAT